MSRASRQQKAEAVLKSLEDQFSADLVAELKRCAAGSWGLFGQNPHTVNMAEALIEQGEAIANMRQELGFTEPYLPFSRFLEYRQM